MINDQLSPETEKKINTLIAQNEGISIEETSLADQNKFLKGFSWGALVYGFFYFAFMKDKLYTVLSIILGLLFPPFIIVLAINARRRAWASKTWLSYNQFMKNQKFWDKIGLYGIVIMLIFSWFLLQYMYTMLSKLVPGNETGFTQLKDIGKSLQDIFGN